MKLSPLQREDLLKALKTRFEKNMNRHKGLGWAKVQAKLEAFPDSYVFVYHNGAESCYAVRGFRGSLRV
jgi:predicted small secreted protein